jgi:hypothetical protein
MAMMDPEGRRGEEDAMTVVAVIFRRMETAVAVRNLWTRDYEPYADGGGAPVRAGSVGRLGPSRRTTEQYHYRLRKGKKNIYVPLVCGLLLFPPNLYMFVTDKLLHHTNSRPEPEKAVLLRRYSCHAKEKFEVNHVANANEHSLGQCKRQTVQFDS